MAIAEIMEMPFLAKSDTASQEMFVPDYVHRVNMLSFGESIKKSIKYKFFDSSESKAIYDYLNLFLSDDISFFSDSSDYYDELIDIIVESKPKSQRQRKTKYSKIGRGSARFIVDEIEQ